MPALRPPRWLWRILLLLPPAICWAALLLPAGNLLSDSLAYRLNFQITWGCLVFGPRLSPEALERRETTSEERPKTFAHSNILVPANWAQVQEMILILDCLENRHRGFVVINSWPGARHIVIADWLVALVLSPLALPFLNAIRLSRRRSWLKRHNRCVACGYSLQGLPTPRCPECGLPFHAPDSTGRTADDRAPANCHY